MRADVSKAVLGTVDVMSKAAQRGAIGRAASDESSHGSDSGARASPAAGRKRYRRTSQVQRNFGCQTRQDPMCAIDAAPGFCLNDEDSGSEGERIDIYGFADQCSLR